MKNWDPAYYDTHCILQYNTAIKMLENFAFTKNDTVLDIGSGSGKITHQIAKLVPHGHATGLDISKEMVDFSKNKYQASNLNFIQCDVFDMQFDNQFDVIVSFWTLSWVENQALAFENITNALKPNGKLLIMYPMKHDAYNVADELIKQTQWQKFFSSGIQLRPFMTKEQYISACHSEQMELSINSKEIPCHFSSIAEMKSSIQSWMRHLDLLPSDDLKKTFLNEFTEAYLKHRRISEPTMFFSVLEISGNKTSPKATLTFR